MTTSEAGREAGVLHAPVSSFPSVGSDGLRVIGWPDLLEGHHRAGERCRTCFLHTEGTAAATGILVALGVWGSTED